MQPARGRGRFPAAAGLLILEASAVMLIDLDKVPFRAFLARMRIKPGNCLDHYCRMIRLPDPTRYRLCMGSARGPDFTRILHCWLEAREIVVDLTRPEKFFDRGHYYARYAVGEVRRYTGNQAWRQFRRNRFLVEFWEFDLSQYSWGASVA